MLFYTLFEFLVEKKYILLYRNLLYCLFFLPNKRQFYCKKGHPKSWIFFEGWRVSNYFLVFCLEGSDVVSGGLEEPMWRNRGHSLRDYQYHVSRQWENPTFLLVQNQSSLSFQMLFRTESIKSEHTMVLILSLVEHHKEKEPMGIC